MLRAVCPDCGEMIEIKENMRAGSRVACIECGIELEVLSLYPLELDYALDDEWGDDWEEDDLYEEWDDE